MKKGKKKENEEMTNEQKMAEEWDEEMKRRMPVQRIVIVEYWNTIQVNPDNVIKQGYI